ncbi:AfsR/SARP family transcriptional regulator [Frankia sp. R82]|uniref:AfsR/SARP family transcriptional regulator n=1 Tax=Frankia sp. R82 TaxID=2950553 RepID=UPI00204492BD|nr:AfsR/SARP family transcriptional regulator [Frankia sp. R82]MCM3885875.1 AfsR/SARP family transcriptional regulator [Frankia sp. R82]
MRYEILGPLRVLSGERRVQLSAPKMTVLLAALLARRGQVVASDLLVSEIWPDEPPRRATATLQVYVSQLRKVLTCPLRPECPILTRPPGYLLNVDAEAVDLHRFESGVAAGRADARAGRHLPAAERFTEALAVWRGPALAGLRDGPVVDAFVTRLEESRLECIEMMMEVGLLGGRHRELTGQLFELTLEHPLREAFYRQLMLALYRSERQADALRVYQRARQILADELGLEPGRPLREIQRAILADDDRFELSSTG